MPTRTPVDRGFYPPTIHPYDAAALQSKDTPDVAIRPRSGGLVLGEDLVLSWGRESDAVDLNRPGAPPKSERWLVSVCDASANHLAILAITPGYPTDGVLTAAIATAQAAYPMHVRIPDEATR